MRRNIRILPLIAFALALFAEGPQKPTETFVWKRGNRIIGRLSVPKGTHAKVYDYLEGIVTTLQYQDGAYIKLQAGLMYRVPLFPEPEYKLVSSTEGDTKITRVGRCGNEKLNWREDNYKPKKSNNGRTPWIALWPPNIGYANVSSDRKPEFDNALDSFIREADENSGSTGLNGRSSSR
jgi:hypothetical protein